MSSLTPLRFADPFNRDQMFPYEKGNYLQYFPSSQGNFVLF